MPQEKERKHRPPGPSQPHNESEERRRTPVDDEIDDLVDEADEIVKRNRENAKKKQPSRE
ncbi:MAG: hypothetical protein A2655_04670 [Candidatus Yanofskybacteria bacterium RIFCSPHIGHO2_01_FULL_43_42]|uniref:Uncharacterized protein n=1 Tax=Candidatus Yanofskybacteria bacterium RIFCSPLOWO2_01_FULL_43_22 TaxID=1802695 RepID=A0A1F8GEQ1_9BACT|nr:MAG: hypothetical protein A2655_04670 [Candidatus Yanofskybacteria bacterium RIFCSPHIGHO2_01_FULL_43_42]OGN12803.1 MAG: hypothetical protein A3D48_00965 [Candidatus Yanofskybacteria bacterium RIFCSPHIGHO2_02_FULL_43_17]OGN23862.1 MAG: hypothetical protein A3A13_02105 [Candidatus Yanofskybacteria bacterium RIFCSPLOWO2_01_FULL_43_22]